MTEPNDLPQQPPDLKALLGPLVDHGVDFVMIGGMAGAARGSTYPSYDLDIAYDRDGGNLKRLADSLESIGVRLRGVSDDLPFILDVRTLENGSNFTFDTPFGDFDILGHVPGVGSYSDLRVASTIEHIAGYDVRVASIDHLISMKRAANRTKDKLMLEEYLVIAELEQEDNASSDSGPQSS